MRRFILPALMGALFALPALAGQGPVNKVLRSANGQVVTSQLSGTCVLTNWHGGAEHGCVTQPVAPAKPCGMSASESTVYFGHDSAELTPMAMQQLDAIAARLQEMGDKVQGVRVVGFADASGDDEYNIRLSAKRAQTVQAYLQGRGVSNAMVAIAEGERNVRTQCPANLKRAERIACQAVDRRVVVQVQTAPVAVPVK